MLNVVFALGVKVNTCAASKSTFTVAPAVKALEVVNSASTFSKLTASSAILALVTLASFIFAVVIASSAITFVVTLVVAIFLFYHYVILK